MALVKFTKMLKGFTLEPHHNDFTEMCDGSVTKLQKAAESGQVALPQEGVYVRSARMSNSLGFDVYFFVEDLRPPSPATPDFPRKSHSRRNSYTPLLSGWLYTPGVKAKRSLTVQVQKRRYFTLKQTFEPFPQSKAKSKLSWLSKKQTRSRSKSQPPKNEEGIVPTEQINVPCYELVYEREQTFFSVAKVKIEPIGRMRLYAHSVVVKSPGLQREGVEPSTRSTFELFTGPEQLVMAADTEKQANQWVEVLRQSIEELRSLNASQPLDLSGLWISQYSSHAEAFAKTLGFGPAKRMIFGNNTYWTGFAMQIQQTGRHFSVSRTFAVKREEYAFAVNSSSSKTTGVNYRFDRTKQVRTGYTALSTTPMLLEADWKIRKQAPAMLSGSETRRVPSPSKGCDYLLRLKHWRKGASPDDEPMMEERYFLDHGCLVIESSVGKNPDPKNIFTLTFHRDESLQALLHSKALSQLEGNSKDIAGASANAEPQASIEPMPKQEVTSDIPMADTPERRNSGNFSQQEFSPKTTPKQVTRPHATADARIPPRPRRSSSVSRSCSFSNNFDINGVEPPLSGVWKVDGYLEGSQTQEFFKSMGLKWTVLRMVAQQALKGRQTIIDHRGSRIYFEERIHGITIFPGHEGDIGGPGVPLRPIPQTRKMMRDFFENPDDIIKQTWRWDNDGLAAFPVSVLPGRGGATESSSYNYQEISRLNLKMQQQMLTIFESMQKRNPNRIWSRKLLGQMFRERDGMPGPIKAYFLEKMRDDAYSKMSLVEVACYKNTWMGCRYRWMSSPDLIRGAMPKQHFTAKHDDSETPISPSEDTELALTTREMCDYRFRPVPILECSIIVQEAVDLKPVSAFRIHPLQSKCYVVVSVEDVAQKTDSAISSTWMAGRGRTDSTDGPDAHAFSPKLAPDPETPDFSDKRKGVARPRRQTMNGEHDGKKHKALAFRWDGGRQFSFLASDLSSDVVVKVFAKKNNFCVGQALIPLSSLCSMSEPESETTEDTWFALLPLAPKLVKFRSGVDMADNSGMKKVPGGSGSIRLEITTKLLPVELWSLKSNASERPKPPLPPDASWQSWLGHKCSSCKVPRSLHSRLLLMRSSINKPRSKPEPNLKPNGVEHKLLGIEQRVLLEVIERLRRVFGRKFVFRSGLELLPQWKRPLISGCSMVIVFRATVAGSWWELPLLCWAFIFCLSRAGHDCPGGPYDPDRYAWIKLWNSEVQADPSAFSKLKFLRKYLGPLQGFLLKLTSNVERADNALTWADETVTSIAFFIFFIFTLLASMTMWFMSYLLLIRPGWLLCAFLNWHLFLPVNLRMAISNKVSEVYNAHAKKKMMPILNAMETGAVYFQVALFNLWQKIPDEAELVHRNISMWQRRGRPSKRNGQDAVSEEKEHEKTE